MRLQYIYWGKERSISPEIRLESTSPAFRGLEIFLEEVKLELAEIQFKKPKSNLTPHNLSTSTQTIVARQNHCTQKGRQGNNIRHDEQRK